jgi:hypothetical protein
VNKGFLRAAFAMRRVGWLATIPIKPGQKMPAVGGWQEYGFSPPSDHLLARWATLHPSAGVGFVYGGSEQILGVDLDFIDEQTANRAFALTKTILGPTPFLRIGLPPKRLMLYRYLGTAALPGKVFSGFELFLKTGQTVFAGIHPATGLPYDWVIKSPQDSPPSDAPETTYEKVIELIEALRPLGAARKTAGVSDHRRTNPMAPIDLGASDRRSGAVASVLPELRAADAPLAAATEIIAAAQPGGRYPAAFGVVVALVQFGFDDKAIWNAVSPPFAAHFPDAAERRARLGTIASALRWARAEIGPDAATLAADPVIQSLQQHWEAGRS